MDNLNFKLSEKEFSKGRKALLWIVGSIFTLIGLWDIYKSIELKDDRISVGVVTVTFSIAIFIFLVAFLASRKKQDHFFNVDDRGISYNYGMLLESKGNFEWTGIDHINFPPHRRAFILHLKAGGHKEVNLNWIEKTKGKSILRHVYYSAGIHGIRIIRK